MGNSRFAYPDRDLWVVYWIKRGRRPKICAEGEVAMVWMGGIEPGGDVLAKALLQGRFQLGKNLFSAGAALRYPDLAAWLDQEAAPVAFPIDVQYHVVLDPIQGYMGAFCSGHIAPHGKSKRSKSSIVLWFVPGDVSNMTPWRSRSG